MAGIAEAGVNKIIDVVDATTGSALEAVQELKDAAADTARGLVTVVDDGVDPLFTEAEELRARLIGVLRSLVAKVTEPLP